MVMELIAGALMLLVLIPVVRHIARTYVSRGWYMNMFEAMILFIRDDVARPSIGGHGADRFLPYLWTVFFFILFNNLLGIIPGGASPTGNINVTVVLAIMTLVTVTTAGMREMGVAGFWVGLVPHLEVPGWLKPPLWGLMFVIEIAGLADPPHRAERPVVRQHVRGSRGALGHPRLHPAHLELGLVCLVPRSASAG